MRNTDEQEFLKTLINNQHGVDTDIEDIANALFKRYNPRKQFHAQSQDTGIPALYRVFVTLQEGLAQALTEMEQEIREKFPTATITNKEILILFTHFFITQVLFVRRLCDSEDEAIREFEKLNNRGKSLSNLDILRAKMMALDEQGIDGQVSTYMDKASNALPGGTSHARIFIRAMAIGGFTWSDFYPTSNPLETFIGKKAEKHLNRATVIDVAEEMADAAEFYERHQVNKDTKHVNNPNLDNIHKLGVYPIIMPILLSARKMKSDVFREFVRVLEATVFVYLNAGESSQKPLEQMLAKWCRHVQKIATMEQLQTFVKEEYSEKFLNNPDKKYGDRFLKGLQALDYSNPSDRRKIKLFLNRYAYALQGVPNVNTSGIRKLPDRTGTQFDIEHILSRQIAETTYPENANTLGNLTLLEKTENRGQQDAPLDKKIDSYKISMLWITQVLVPGEAVGQLKRLSASVPQLPEKNNPDQTWFQARTQHMIAVAQTIYGLNGWTVDTAPFKDADFER